MTKESGEVLAVVIAGLSAATLIASLGGLLVRFVLFPWLRDHLVGPLLTRLDTLTSDLRVAAMMWEGHVTASEHDRGRLWDAIEDIRRTRHPPGRNDPP